MSDNTWDLYAIRSLDYYGAMTYTRLDGHNSAGGNLASQTQVLEDDIGVLAVVVAASVVSVHTKVVAQAVGEEGLADSGVEDVVLVALEDAQSQQAVNGDPVGQDVCIFPVHAGLDNCNALLLHLVDDVVDLAALLGEFAVERKGSGLLLHGRSATTLIK